MSAVAHIAGPASRKGQSCIRCGHVLIESDKIVKRDGQYLFWNEDHMIIYDESGAQFDATHIAQSKPIATPCTTDRMH